MVTRLHLTSYESSLSLSLSLSCSLSVSLALSLFHSSGDLNILFPIITYLVHERAVIKCSLKFRLVDYKKMSYANLSLPKQLRKKVCSECEQCTPQFAELKYCRRNRLCNCFRVFTIRILSKLLNKCTAISIYTSCFVKHQWPSGSLIMTFLIL